MGKMRERIFFFLDILFFSLYRIVMNHTKSFIIIIIVAALFLQPLKIDGGVRCYREIEAGIWLILG